MAKLAIKGHETRCKKVIEILEMLGGKNKFEDISFIKPYHFLYVDDDYYTEIGWEFIGDDNNYEEFVIYTLEEFLEKYPYKVGDRVSYRADKLLETQVITNMRWDSNYDCVLYYLDNFNIIKVEDILYKIGSPEDNIPTIQDKSTVETMEDKDMEEKDKAKAPDLKGEDYSDKRFGYKIPDGYEFDTVYNGNIILKPIKPQYPKTYKECCRIVNANPCVRLIYDLSNGQKYSYDVDNLQQYENIRKLLICRDAYWKIAGEQMGLDKPWEYAMSTDEFAYAIVYQYGSIEKCEVRYKNHFLVFPTKETRDEFYKCFKELIEKCKELL